MATPELLSRAASSFRPSAEEGNLPSVEVLVLTVGFPCFAREVSLSPEFMADVVPGFRL